MAWIITKDYLREADERGAEGIASRDWKDARAGDKTYAPHAFRLYDDDGVLYYEGRSTALDSFRPLDEFGMGYAGCTEIAYWRPGDQWEQL